MLVFIADIFSSSVGIFFPFSFVAKYMECIQTSNALFEFCLMFFGGLLATAGCQHFFITLK